MSTALFTKEKYQFIPMEKLVYRILKLSNTRFIIILKPYPIKICLKCSHKVYYLICLHLCLQHHLDCFRSLKLAFIPAFCVKVVLSITNKLVVKILPTSSKYNCMSSIFENFNEKCNKQQDHFPFDLMLVSVSFCIV